MITSPQKEILPSYETAAVEGLSTTKAQLDQISLNENHPFLDFAHFKNLPPENMTFLHSKGALEIPSQESMEEFVNQYFKEIHPMLPVIDEAQFWAIFTGNSTQRFSLFVFQALLFVSCSVWPLNTTTNDVPTLSGLTSPRDSLLKFMFCAGAAFWTNAMPVLSCTIGQRSDLHPYSPSLPLSEQLIDLVDVASL